jgi:hypothetical protein
MLQFSLGCFARANTGQKTCGYWENPDDQTAGSYPFAGVCFSPIGPPRIRAFAGPIQPFAREELHYFDVFIGPSYGKMALGSETALFAPTSRNFYGLDLNVKMNLHKNLGIILLDAGMLFGHTKIPSPLGSQFDAHTSLQSYQFLFGPEVAYRGRQVQLFAHGLFGANHTAAVWDLSSNDSLSLIGRTHFALGAGVGLDVNFKEHFAYRVFQADYIPTLVDGRWEKNYRVSTGIVFRF